MAEKGDLKEFLADSKKLIGKEAPDVANGISVVDIYPEVLRRFG